MGAIRPPAEDAGAAAPGEFGLLNPVGVAARYLRQVRQTGVLGLVGYLVYAAGYLVILSTSFVGAYVLPEIAETDRAYVDDVLAVATGGSATGDIGLLANAFQLQGVGYLAGGLLFGIIGIAEGPADSSAAHDDHRNLIGSMRRAHGSIFCYGARA